MIDVVTMSSKGQFVIPRDIREEMKIRQQDRFIIVHDNDSILLKKIKREEANAKMKKLLDKFSRQFQDAGITSDDLKEEIKRARAR